MPFVPDKAAGHFRADQPPAPEESPIASTLKAGAEGYMTGGPIQGVMRAAMEGDKQAAAMLSHGAYRAGGAVTDIASRAGFSPKTSAALGFGTNVGAQAIPMILGGGAGRAAAPVFEKAGRELMQSALKPSAVALRTGKGMKAVDTMLQEGVNVTPGGVRKLQGMIEDLNTQIKEAIKNSNAEVDKNVVAKYADETIERLKKQVKPGADVAAVRNAVKEFLNHPLIAGDKMPVQTAQELKQGTYRALGEKSYGELTGADKEAQKALARGLKEEIAKVVPIGKLNKRESELLNAHSLAVSRVLVSGNKNPMGLGWLAMHPQTWLGFAADRSEFIKSLLARGLYRGAKAIPETAGAAAGGLGGMILGTPQNNPPVTATQPLQPQNTDTSYQGTGVRG